MAFHYQVYYEHKRTFIVGNVKGIFWNNHEGSTTSSFQMEILYGGNWNLVSRLLEDFMQGEVEFGTKFFRSTQKGSKCRDLEDFFRNPCFLGYYIHTCPLQNLTCKMHHSIDLFDSLAYYLLTYLPTYLESNNLQVFPTYFRYGTYYLHTITYVVKLGRVR